MDPCLKAPCCLSWKSSSPLLWILLHECGGVTCFLVFKIPASTSISVSALFFPPIHIVFCLFHTDLKTKFKTFPRISPSLPALIHTKAREIIAYVPEGEREVAEEAYSTHHLAYANFSMSRVPLPRDRLLSKPSSSTLSCTEYSSALFPALLLSKAH